MAGALTGRLFSWTAEDGTFAEVEVSDATVEVARAAIQQVYDARQPQVGRPSFIMPKLRSNPVPE
jgi:hypothetical protein